MHGVYIVKCFQAYYVSFLLPNVDKNALEYFLVLKLLTLKYILISFLSYSK